MLWNVAALKQLKSRDVLRVERDDLAVEQQRSIRELADSVGYDGKCSGAIVLISREQGYLRAFLIREDSVAVVFFLIDPTGSIERFWHQGREHGIYAEGDALAHCLILMKPSVGFMLPRQG